jgi:vacuolar-type H+-ATPase subunit E/Vma4
MNSLLKITQLSRVTFFNLILFGCFVFALSLAAAPARAVDAEADAQKAFDKWRAAKAAVDDAKEALKKAQTKRDNLMAAATGGAKLTDAQQAQLAAARAEVAKAEAALEAAEKNLQNARIELEKALAELPEDSKVKKELKRLRDAYNSMDNMNAQIVSANGLRVVTFNTVNGGVTVNLPDDIRAGDTISGTVIPEPKGSTEEERKQNRGVLNGYIVEVEGQKFPVNKGTVGPFVIRRLQPPTGSGMPPPPPIDSFFDIFFAVSLNDLAPRRATVPLLPSGAVITPDPKITQPFNIPPIGQQGRPFVIPGPFDGDSSNTSFNWTPVGSDNALSGFNVIAESPRKAVFAAPTDVAGPLEVNLKEGGRETSGQFRNVGVNLSAPKTSLLKGESTTLKIEVSGLQGITEPVPLHLVKGGVVTMQGGDVQSMTIKPAEVQSNGTFTTTRTITGVQTGVWNATATVVVFDTCLEDDGDPLRVLLFSVTTGDYIFCPGRGNVAGTNPSPLSTLNFGGTDFTGGVRVAAGDVNDSGGSGPGLVSIGPSASMYRNGAVTVADFNYKLGSIHVQIDPFNHTGNAIVQTTKPKQTFTITDRDTRNNTCACK